jgi:DNA-binding response OmpR family regulator
MPERPGSLSILQVDSDPHFLMLTRVACFVGDSRFQLITADSLSGAIDLLQGGRRVPDLVLAGWELDQGTGLDLLRFVRSDERLSRVPVVIVGAAQPLIEARVAELGGDYLNKPQGFQQVKEFCLRLPCLLTQERLSPDKSRNGRTPCSLGT